MKLKKKINCLICNYSLHAIFSKKIINITSSGNFDISIKVCKCCGFVSQRKILSPQKLVKYYKSVANYSNSGNDYNPKEIVKTDVSSQIKFIKKNLKTKKKILQVGSSNGYTLSKLKRYSKSSVGIEPSLQSCQIARKKYNLKNIICKNFEQAYKKIGKFDIIILTHVLEHLADPLKVLKILFEKLEENGRILIEVPYLSNHKYLPINYFTFEHLYYFDSNALINLINKSGFEVEGKIQINLKHKVYPIQRMIIKKRKKLNKINIIKNSRVRNFNILKNYEIKNSKNTKFLIKKILNSLKGKDNVVWGAGAHSSILFSGQRKILKRVNFFVDSDPKKINKKIYNKIIISPKKFLQIKSNNTKVITSTITEYQINNFLYNQMVVLMFFF